MEAASAGLQPVWPAAQRARVGSAQRADLPRASRRYARSWTRRSGPGAPDGSGARFAPSPPPLPSRVPSTAPPARASWTSGWASDGSAKALRQNESLTPRPWGWPTATHRLLLHVLCRFCGPGWSQATAPRQGWSPPAAGAAPGASTAARAALSALHKIDPRILPAAARRCLRAVRSVVLEDVVSWSSGAAASAAGATTAAPVLAGSTAMAASAAMSRLANSAD
jgi:hypothetical protein